MKLVLVFQELLAFGNWFSASVCECKFGISHPWHFGYFPEIFILWVSIHWLHSLWDLYRSSNELLKPAPHHFAWLIVSTNSNFGYLDWPWLSHSALLSVSSDDTTSYVSCALRDMVSRLDLKDCIEHPELNCPLATYPSYMITAAHFRLVSALLACRLFPGWL